MSQISFPPDFISTNARRYVQNVLFVQGTTCFVYKDKSTLYASSHSELHGAGRIAFILKPKNSDHGKS